MNWFWFFIFALSICEGLYLDLNPEFERCIGQELDEEDVATFKLSVAPETKQSSAVVIATISDPSDNTIFTGKLSHSVTEHKQNIRNRGVFNICFTVNNAMTNTRVFVDVEFKSRSELEKKNSLISKKLASEYIPTLEDELKSIEDILSNVGNEIEFARRQELVLKQAGETTQSRIQWFSALSIVVLVCTTLYQLIYLRKYFMDKKIL